MNDLPRRFQLSIPRQTHSGDGTRLAYYRIGAGSEAGDEPGRSVVLLAGSVGAHELLWGPQLSHLSARHEMLAWDARGLFASGQPSRPAYDAHDQVADLIAVLEAERIGAVSIVAWSAGVRVALDACRALAEGGGAAVKKLVLLSGNAGRRARVLRTLARFGADLAKLRGGGGPSAGWLASSLVHAGMAGPSLPPQVVVALAETLVGEDPHTLLTTFSALDTLGALDVARHIEVPTLLVAGDRDPLMPAALVHQLGRALPRSRVLIVPGGHHYLQLEYPDLVNLQLERFLDDAA